jgi:hypothetical protein
VLWLLLSSYLIEPRDILSRLVAVTLKLSVLEAHFDCHRSAIIGLVVFAICLKVDRREIKHLSKIESCNVRINTDIDTETGIIKSVHNGMYNLI